MISNTRVILWYYSIWRDVIFSKSHLLFMVEITENTKNLVTSCMIQRLSTNEALDYLKENRIDISERTYRRYKEEILKQKNKLKSYSQKFVEIEQFKKIETQKNILHECWEMLKKTEKITEKISIMKMIREVSDEFPNTVWAANYYGSRMKSLRERKKRYKAASF
uniref:Uncharacterized protein n=1 Tax=uncultured marine thaumarchaeote KM3_23_E01 TaxID=1456099 RepID=A0A075GUY2_9ARCH|nr:hypothetical protein [uncultured marine thaumarchaeote KM3_23_E01]